MNSPGRVGYIGVDVLNNATICNEAPALLEQGVPLEVVSVYRFDEATFHTKGTLRNLATGLTSLYPLRPLALAWAMFCGPWVFGFHFWSALWGALSCPAEGFRQRCRIWMHFFPALILALRWRKKGIGHIHAHWAHTATTIAMHTAKLLGIGFSFTGHANDLFVHRVGLVGKLRRARFIVAISEYHRRLYIDLGANPDQLAVVYCGIDLSHYSARETGTETATTRPRIVGVGRLVEKKGFHDLVAACGMLRDRGLLFECVIAGSGPEETGLRAAIADRALEELVRVTGKPVFQEELPTLLRSATVFALPCVKDRDGDMDGLPQVLIEAMACGVPVVTTRLVGIPDLVRHEEHGLMVASGNVGELANALAEMLQNQQWAARRGASASVWVREHFGREEAVRRLKQLFLWAAATPGNSPPPFELPSAPGSDAYYGRESADAVCPAPTVSELEMVPVPLPRGLK